MYYYNLGIPRIYFFKQMNIFFLRRNKTKLIAILNFFHAIKTLKARFF